MTLDEESIIALAPDGRSVVAARELLKGDVFSSTHAAPDGQRLAASCQGSMPRPYRVWVQREGDTFRFDCDCGSAKYPCKHALALLFLQARRPDRFREDAALAAEPPLTTQERRIKQSTAGPAEAKDEGEALLQAIFREPDEFAHRLVYADWIDEQGDPDRAQLIRVQCELERGPAATRLKELRRQESALLKANRAAWLADVPKHLRGKVDLRRGFVSHLDLPPKALLRYGPGLFERYPIYSVGLRGENWSPQEISRLVVEPFWARVRELTLLISALDQLLGCPFLKNLRHLVAAHTAVGIRGAGALGAWPGLKELRSLELITAEITDSAVAWICDGEPTRLESWRLMDNHIGNAGAETLAGCAALRSLRALDLWDNRIGPKGVKALASSPHLAALRVLNLSNNPITDQGARALAESPYLESLEELHLALVELSDRAVAMLRGRFGERVFLR